MKTFNLTLVLSFVLCLERTMKLDLEMLVREKTVVQDSHLLLYFKVNKIYWFNICNLKNVNT